MGSFKWSAWWCYASSPFLAFALFLRSANNVLSTMTMTIQHYFTAERLRIIDPDHATGCLLDFLRCIPRLIDELIRDVFQCRNVLTDKSSTGIDIFEVFCGIEICEMVLKKTIAGKPVPAKGIDAPISI